MKKVLLVFAISLLSITGFTQNNQTVINYSLSKSLGASVGPDLVVNDNRLCIDKAENAQMLYEATGNQQRTIFISIDNNGGGNGCLTLIVQTTSDLKKIVVSQDSQSGVLRFDRVKYALVTIEKQPTDSTVDVATSLGKAIVWF